MKTKSFVLVILSLVILTAGQNRAGTQMSIIPLPKKITPADGSFELDEQTRIAVSGAATKKIARMLNEFISPATGFSLEITNGKDTTGKYIEFKIDDNLSNLTEEGYELNVTPDAVTIASAGQAGLFYGVQTLRQLLPAEIYSREKQDSRNIKWLIPAIHIEDAPEFKWRGMHLDVCRHFMPVEFVKKYIDLLAMHKMNKFHWHLTDDQGWRIEIKKYPRLTEIGAWREQTIVGHQSGDPENYTYDGTRHGGFYTQQEIKEVLEYAKKRFVTVIPEIEMPGHCHAAVASYPNLSCKGGDFEVGCRWGGYKDVYCPGKEKTFEFLQNVLTEVIELFPGEYIHIGGDECSKERWRQCPKCQKRIAEENLENEKELQSYFIKRIERFLNKKGRKVIGWDEILEGGLSPTATVMSWRSEQGGITAAKNGNDVIMAPNPYTYFDYYQGKKENEPLAIGGFLPLEKVYSYHPVPEVLNNRQAEHILGAQGQVWTEYIKDSDHVEYMAYPRACALAEVVWSESENKNFDYFYDRLKKHTRRLDWLDVNYRELDSESDND